MQDQCHINIRANMDHNQFNLLRDIVEPTKEFIKGKLELSFSLDQNINLDTNIKDEDKLRLCLLRDYREIGITPDEYDKNKLSDAYASSKSCCIIF